MVYGAERLKYINSGSSLKHQHYQLPVSLHTSKSETNQS